MADPIGTVCGRENPDAIRFVRCDLCGSSEAADLFAHEDACIPNEGLSFRVVECRGCGLIYLTPRPQGSGLAALYPQEYHDTLQREGRVRRRSGSLGKRIRRSLLEQFYQYPIRGGRSGAATNSLLRRARATFLQLERWRLRMGGREATIIPFVGAGRLLDVGCGTGKDLDAFKEMGWDITGVEVSAYAASVARQRLECEILVGDFEEVPLGDEGFDVVRFSHSLEHLPSPRRALEKAYRVLRAGGLLWIEVPNAASLERRLFGKHWIGWDLPRHFYHFTPWTLSRMLACTGFRPVKVKCDARTLFFTESVANVVAHRFGVRPRWTKLLSALARPVVYALGAVNRGAVLTVHADKVVASRTCSSGSGSRCDREGLSHERR